MRYALLLAFVAILTTSCGTESAKEPSTDGLDRTVLPIQPPKIDPYTELDVRNTEPPERFQVKAPDGAPNVVVILIDDIGFGATKPYGGIIETPTFERLAQNGVRYNQFHTTALCSPTRVALKSGHNHHANNAGAIMELATAYPGNTAVIPQSIVPLAEILRLNGYSTGAFGKWHETAPWEVSVSGPYDRWPHRQGFDKFYGFIAGETNQWDPFVFDGVTNVEPEKGDGYHFTTDMTNQAISYVKNQQAMTPDKPFMVYFSTGAVHAPHHVSKEWIDKYKGQFDMGWDKLREQTLARQIEMGIVPEGTELAPKPDDIKDWDQLTDKEKELFLHQVETYAGFMSHTDHEVGRFVSAIEDIGELDNTLIVYIMGDNGTSAEGGMLGTYNELMHLSGIFDVETVDEMLSHKEDWGGPMSFPHMAAGWAVGTAAPFGWTKQVAADFGGTRNGMVIHWPNGVNSKGEIRSQFHHVVDVAPTVLEAASIPQPKMVNGIKQRPMDGTSMVYSFDNADAPTTHNTQYFEIFGNRAIYHDGWLARTIHKRPWGNDVEAPLNEDKWDLYNVNEDFSLAHNLADENPEKLKELKDLFDKEAVRNNVYPIDDRSYERFDAKTAGRPDLMDGRKTLRLAEGMVRMTENAFINVKNTSKTIESNVTLKGRDNGVILCQGGRFGGWALYMKDGKVGYHYNWFNHERYNVMSTATLPSGNADIKLRFDYDGDGMGKGGMATIYVNGEQVAQGRIEMTQPVIFSADDVADVGVDLGTPVVNSFESSEDTEFTGKINTLEVSID